MKKRKMYMRMITASLLRRRSRMIVALLAIAIGATILSGLVTIYYDVPRQMGAQFRSYGANMLFTAVNDTFSQEDVDNAVAVIPESQRVGVAPYRYETVRMNDRPVLAAATDMEGAKSASPFWRVNGDWPSADGQLMIGKSVASLYKLNPGDKIEVTYTPVIETENSSSDEEALEENADEEFILDNYIDFEVVGILDTGGNEEEYIYMTLNDMEKLTGKANYYNVCELSVSATADELSVYADKISEGVEGINARLVKRVTQSETTVLSKLQSLVLLVTVVVLALTMICVATTMTAVVAERRKEIGLRKALGASDKSIIGEFMGEGLLLGFAGGFLGAFLGFLFAQGVSVSVFNSSISFRPLLLPVTIIVSVVVTGVACLIPIRSATDVDPALVLKGE
ncbi:MAG: ABC transporter permease [Lachnospiraceae bacterium]|nr:ABC transporter permease [Lachnospiraceae bacterium]